MKTVNELKEALNKQTKTNNDFKLAVENMNELAKQNEDAFCQVLVVVTKLLNEFGSIGGGSVI